MMQQNGLLGLLAAATSVSAGVIKVPLKTRAAGVNVPVTDWFNRTDNQVCIHTMIKFFCEVISLLTFSSGTVPFL